MGSESQSVLALSREKPNPHGFIEGPYFLELVTAADSCLGRFLVKIEQGSTQLLDLHQNSTDIIIS